MNNYGTCCLLMALQLLLLSVAAQGAAIDDYFLAKFGKRADRTSHESEASTHSHGKMERCRTHLHLDLKKSWKLLAPETQKTLARVLARPALSGEERVFPSAGGHFSIRYASSGTDAPPAADSNGNGVPDWVETVATVFEEVYAAEVTGMMYLPAPTAGGRYDVYLQNVGKTLGVYGVTDSDKLVSNSGGRSYTSYITIDNDFSAAEYGTQHTAEEALRITAAHEYFHAIQFGYNYWFEFWYSEATATWIEDEIYDNINQLYDYLAPYMSHSMLPIDTAPDVSTGGGYGRWIFARHLAERFSPVAIRESWEQLAQAAVTGNDIPMLPLLDTLLTGKGSSMGDEFFHFTKKLYERNWSRDTSHIPSVTPVATYSSYPADTGETNLSPYSFAYLAFQQPSATLADLVLTQNSEAGIRGVAFTTSGTETTAYTPDGTTGAITVPSFNAPGRAPTYLLLSNSSSSDAKYRTTGSLVTVDVTPPAVTADPAGGSYTGSRSVTLSASEAATIYYTLDGTTPTYPVTGSTQVYTGPVVIGGTSTLSYIARDSAGNTGTPVSQVYAISYSATVATAGTGSGSINSSPSGIACTTGSTAGCSATFSSNSTIELFATPDSSSIFAGWSGACTNTTGKCTMTMDTSKNTTATFTRQAPASIAGSTTGYATLQQAYAAAPDHATIQLMEAADPGSLTAGRAINVTLIGGYDAGYTASSGMTVIQGTIRLRGGKVVAKRVKVK